jgi:hypothetical protein
MDRMAPALGWELESAGGTWRVTNVPAFDGLTYRALSLLMVMTRVAIATPEQGGLGLTIPEVREASGYAPVHTFNRKEARHYLALDGQVSGTDETTLYQVYFEREGR